MLETNALPQYLERTPSGLRKPVCCNCGEEFLRNRPQQEFCKEPCRREFQNRAAVEGRAVIALLKAWRVGRNAKGDTPEAAAIRDVASKSFSEFVSVVDSFIREDREAGRPHPSRYARSLVANGGRYQDRKRER